VKNSKPRSIRRAIGERELSIRRAIPLNLDAVTDVASVEDAAFRIRSVRDNLAKGEWCCKLK
jgi:hypothetical protein